MQHDHTSSSSALLTMATVVDRLPPILQLRAFPVKPFTKEPQVKRWQIARKTPYGQKKLLEVYIKGPVGRGVSWAQPDAVVLRLWEDKDLLPLLR